MLSKLIILIFSGYTLSMFHLFIFLFPKVFPSSFSIKAALGNLKVSDDGLPCSHSYFWICDMRNPGGSSFVEVVVQKLFLKPESSYIYICNLVLDFVIYCILS